MAISFRNQTLFTGTDSAGVDIRYTKRTRTLTIGGWFDSCAGIQGETIRLADLLKGVGVSEGDLRAVIKKWKAQGECKENGNNAGNE